MTCRKHILLHYLLTTLMGAVIWLHTSSVQQRYLLRYRYYIVVLYSPVCIHTRIIYIPNTDYTDHKVAFIIWTDNVIEIVPWFKSQKCTVMCFRHLLLNQTRCRGFDHLWSRTTWWRRPMQTFYALLAIYAGNSPVIGEFSAQRPVTRSYDVFFDLRLNKRSSKQPWGWWYETPLRPLWRHSNAYLEIPPLLGPVIMVLLM